MSNIEQAAGRGLKHVYEIVQPGSLIGLSVMMFIALVLWLSVMLLSRRKA